jgi:hypothetical protein
MKSDLRTLLTAARHVFASSTGSNVGFLPFVKILMKESAALLKSKSAGNTRGWDRFQYCWGSENEMDVIHTMQSVNVMQAQ